MAQELPDNFFTVITEKQQTFVDVLLEEEWIHISDVIDKMESEHGVSVDGPRGIGGIRSGLSRYWTKAFSDDLILSEKTSDGRKYRINPGYVEILHDGFE